jgi:hypothetical protein
MAFQTKKSVMAIVEETTEGTPVSPTAGTEFIAIQDGFELTPSFDTLENAELTGSLGKAKPIQGFENPAGSISHYIKHSAVEGQEPNYGLLLEMAFGDKSIAAAEYNTIAASTTSLIKVDTGEGATYERGEALLIKDGTNGYNIRNVLSIATDDLTLAQQVGTAPGTGVELGKAVLYKPGESHPTCSMWDYRGNNGAVQLGSGMRVTEMSMEIAAGELINGSFSLEGIKFFYNPIEITASSKYFDITDDGGTFAASITEKMYRDPYELAAACETAINAAGSDVFTVTYDDATGKYTITGDGAVLSLLWDTGANTANTIGSKLGFVVSADDTGSLTYTSDNAADLTAGFTPSFDSSNPLVAKDNEVLLGDADDITCFSTQSASFTLTDTKTDVLDVCEESGKAGSIITEREAVVELVANLPQYDVDKFKRFRANDSVQFTYNGGTKSGGNWEAGKCFNLFSPTMVISEFALTDTDGLVALEMSLSAYVASGLGEIYLNFV